MVRFKTILNLKDSDQDGVKDKDEIISYLFDASGDRLKAVRPDIDGDTRRNELDSDSDGGETVDGCEDYSQNGKYEKELGETRNDDPSDDKPLLITLSWPLQGADVDLHLIKPGGQLNSGEDCYYRNKNPYWGSNRGIYRCGDPSLDVDCITQCTVEHIKLDRLETGLYKVKVHYYSDHGKGETSPMVRVTLMGKSYDFWFTVSNNQVRDVCTIDWPTQTVTAVGTVSSLSGAERLTLPGK